MREYTVLYSIHGTKRWTTVDAESVDLAHEAVEDKFPGDVVTVHAVFPESFVDDDDEGDSE